MPRPETERFMAALRGLEASGDVEPLVKCFSSDADLSNLSVSEHGTDGARRFWTGYRRQFANVRSEFTEVIEVDGRAVLLWTSSGALLPGRPVEYRGASVLTWRGDKVCRFETIYDSAAFLRKPTAK